MRLKTALLVACVAIAISITIGWSVKVEAQAQKTVTLSWYHDGVGTDSYNVVVDAAAPISVPMTDCTGTGATRLCSTTITLVTNVQHTVVVSAVNILGTNDSDPFPAGPPKGKPTGVSVK